MGGMPSNLLVVRNRSIRRHRALSALAGVLVAGALILSGCITDVNPDPTTTSTIDTPAPTPEPTQSTETTKPTTPEPEPEPRPPDPAQLINENTEEGARSAVAYFLELRQYTIDAADDSEWKSRSTNECQYCPIVTEVMEELLNAEQYRDGGEILVKHFVSAEEKWPNHWVVEFVGVEYPVTLYGPSGVVIFEDAGGEAGFAMFVKFVNSDWKLDEVTN